MAEIKEIEIHYINIGGSALHNIIQNTRLADVDESHSKYVVDL